MRDPVHVAGVIVAIVILFGIVVFAFQQCNAGLT